MDVKYLHGPAAQALYDWMLEDGIKPHAAGLAPIIAAGDVAVVVFNLVPECEDAARSLGWDGSSPFFRMSSAKRKAFGRALKSIGDHVAHDWLNSKRPGRIYLMVEAGTYLVNFEPGHGYSIEPGSQTAEDAEADVQALKGSYAEGDEK